MTLLINKRKRRRHLFDDSNHSHMPISRLIFFPKNTQLLVNDELILKTISRINFINKVPYEKNHYLPGEHFLSLLTFLGCSPNINLTPTPDQAHCFVSLLSPTEDPQCLGYTNTCNPKCPNCTKRIANWKTDNWQKTGASCQCDKCGTQLTYAELNWKQECGFARCGFEIAHIHPHEAVPTDQLLEALEEKTRAEWLYCYTNN